VTILSAANISQVYLSLIRTFQFYPQRPTLNPSFDFLADDAKYYNSVISGNTTLGQMGKSVPGLGKLRSPLDGSCALNQKKKVEADSLLTKFQDYYTKLYAQKLTLTAHYPCVIDILPSKGVNYQLDSSTLPGSLSSAEEKETKMSASLRIYPAGLASLRLGLFLSTQSSFKTEDIIEFLKGKNAVVKIKAEQFTIEDLTAEYRRRLLAGLNTELNSFNWEDTFSFVDIIKAAPLTLAQNQNDVFLPLLCLKSAPRANECSIDNLSEDPDILLPGSRCFVSYLPSGEKPDRRKVRGWLRNSLELYYMQKFLIQRIAALTDSANYSSLLEEVNWMIKVKKWILPPKIASLLSAMNYTSLHTRIYPLQKDVWRTRYNKTLLVLDKGNDITTANAQAKTQVDAIVKLTNDNNHEVGSWFQKLVDIAAKFVGKS